MKKIILIILAILPFTGWSIDGNFLLNGKIGKGSVGAKVHLNYLVNGKMKTFTTSCEKGTFQFKGILAEPVLVQLVMDPKGIGLAKLGKDMDALVFILEHGTITLSSKILMKNAIVTGSKLNEENKKFMALLAPVDKEMSKLLSDFYGASAEHQKNGEMTAELQSKLTNLGLKRRTILYGYVKSHTASFLSLQTLMEAVDQKEDLKKVKILFDSLTPALRNSPSGKALKAKL